MAPDSRPQEPPDPSGLAASAAQELSLTERATAVLAADELSAVPPGELFGLVRALAARGVHIEELVSRALLAEIAAR